MAYIVIHRFADTLDNNRIYRVGDKYPRSGFKVDDKRLWELSTTANKIGIPLISAESVPDTTGGSLGSKTGKRTPKAPKAKKTAKKG